MSEHLYGRFESLGNNCEFGIVQRRSGFDPPGLFRNVGFLDIEQIIKAIYSNFEGMFDPGNFDFKKPDGWPDWRLDCNIFGFGFHSTIPAELEREGGEWQSATDRIVKLFRYLKRKIQEDLTEGEKVFVFRSKQVISDRTAARLHSAIRMHGNGSLLLVREDPSRPSGSVEHADEGLIFGYVHRLSNENPPEIDFPAWLSMATQIIESKDIVLSYGNGLAQERASWLPGPPPMDSEAIISHVIRERASMSVILHSMDFEGLQSGKYITVSFWIYLPRKLDSARLNAVFVGFATVRYTGPDLGKYVCWQRISVTTRIPDDQSRAALILLADNIEPCMIYSAGWTMRLQDSI